MVQHLPLRHFDFTVHAFSPHLPLFPTPPQSGIGEGKGRVLILLEGQCSDPLGGCEAVASWGSKQSQCPQLTILNNVWLPFCFLSHQ